MLIIRTFLLLLLCWPAFAQEDEVPPASKDNIAANNQPETPMDKGASDKTKSEDVDTTVPRHLPNPSERRMKETVKYLGLFQRQNETIKFSDEESSISGLYLPENTGSPQGGILILHDIAQHAHWPNNVAPLREYLPDYGWSTLSLFFGNYIKKPLPKTPSTANQDTSENTKNSEPPSEAASTAPETLAATFENEEQETVNEPPLEDENFNAESTTDELDNLAENFEAFPVPSDIETPSVESVDEVSADQIFMETMNERVEGGLQQLNTLGQFNLVVIAHGLSANWAIKTLQDRMAANTNSGGYSLVLVDAKASDFPKYSLNEELASLAIPILDIYTSNRHEEQRGITERRNAVVRQKKAEYTQLRLPSIETIYGTKQNMISRRVRGWLKTHAAGEVVTVK